MAYFIQALLHSCLFWIFYVSALQELDFQTPWQGNGFKYGNCNRSAVPLQVLFMALSSNPVQLGKPFWILVNLTLAEDVGVYPSNIEAELNIRLKTDRGYTELCEIIGEDMCHFDDLCAVLKSYRKNHPCPSEVWKKYHNNCTCPIAKGQYFLPIPLRPRPLSFELRGTFDLRVNLQQQGRHMGCVDMQFCISECQPFNSIHSQMKFLDNFKLFKQEFKWNTSKLAQKLTFP